MNKRVLRYTNTFRKDYKLLVKQHKDMSKLDHVLILLQMGIELDTKYKNHKLINSKKYYDCWECHIEPDWLLIYKITENELCVIAVDTGSHSHLFRK